MKNKKSLLQKIATSFIAVIMMITLSACSSEKTEEQKTDVGNVQEENTNSSNNEDSSVSTTEAELHFIDTGNSDAILIMKDGKAALIDGGDKDDDDKVVNYIKDQGVKELEYVFATHPHADHIGGLDSVVSEIPVKNVFVSNGDAETAAYRDFINAMADKGLNPSVPLLNSKHKLGSSTFEVLSVANEEDPNNNSIVLLYTNGNDKVLLMGDAEKEIEAKINPGDVDILKVGHHGSHSSSTRDFLEKVTPEYAVIPVGKDNRYSHPHVETMDNLEAMGIEVHRNDECSNVVFKSSGNGVSTECKIGSYSSPSDNKFGQSSSSNNTTANNNSSNSSTNSNSSANGSNAGSNNSSNSGSTTAPVVPTPEPEPTPPPVTSAQVYANGGSSTSNKYHSSPTAHNMEGAIPMTEDEAKAQGYVACKICY